MLKSSKDSEKEFYSFSELVDVSTYTQLLENFYHATGIPNGLVGPNGEKISQAGWSDACSLYHRVNPDTKRQCEESNLAIMESLQEGEIASSMCKNGLYDYATPVVIEGHHLGTLFLGQVFDVPPDLKFFNRQAKQFGFDQDEYLNAIRAVPIISKVQMEAHMQAMAGVIKILAANGLARLRESRLKRDLNKSTIERIQMEDLLKFSPVGVGWSDADGNIEYINRKFTELFGYTIDDLPDLETWYKKAYPDAGYREMVIEPWRQRVNKADQLCTTPPELEACVTCKDGSERQVLIQVSWVGDKRLVNFTDISDQWQSEQRNRAHNAMLEMVAKAESLSNILHTLAQSVEEESPSSLCSVHILDEKRKHLLTIAAPSLPEFYNEATDGIEIGDGIGSCGTAVYRRERVIVENISTHEYWKEHADLAKKAGLAACWSEPIISSDGKVLGTFAIYHREPAVPNLEEIERIAFAANLAAIAIENRHTRDELIKRELQFRTLAENAPVNIARYDLEGNLIYANPELVSTILMPMEGHLDKSMVDQPTLLPFSTTFLEAVKHTLQSGDETSFEIKVPTKDGDEETHFFTMVVEKNESDEIKGVLCTGIDITDRKLLEEKLAEREREFRTLADNAPVNIARYDKDGRLIYANPRLVATIPMLDETLIGKRFDEQPEMPFSEPFQKAIDHTKNTGEESTFEALVPAGEKGMETHIITMVAERDESGATTGTLAIGQDITERKQLEERLAEREREFRTLAENIPINISRFDRDGYLIYANSRLAGDFPLTIDKLFGTQLSEEPTQPYTEIVNDSIVRTLRDGVERSFEIEIPVTGGGFVTHLITMVAERDGSGSIIGVLATGQNVSERKRLQRELERQARLDFLTGLLNRRYFMELAKMELLRLKRYSGKLSLIMFDIDHFKQINDTFGHNVGDLVLKRIAHLSHDTVREIDIVGRLGGEEFVVLLPQTDKTQAYDIAERLRHILDTEKVETEDGKIVQFTASFGVVTIDSDKITNGESVNIDDMLIRADQAMYQAKQSGRNKVCQD